MIQQTMTDLFQKTRAEWLEEARSTARKLLADKYYITIEDVLRECPRPSYLNRNTTGRVFLGGDFVSIGEVHSRRPISHGRRVLMWKLKPGFTPPPEDEPGDDEPEHLYEDVA